MPAENIIERAFSGGEISPALYARTDISKYQTGLRTLRNMICMRHGGVTQRPGTMYVGTTLNGGNPVRLIPFIYNETGLGQSYFLEFGNQYIAFYQNGGVVISAPNTPYKIVTPYLQADLATLKFDETADVMTIVHLNYAVRELRRVAPTNWTLTQITNWGSNVPAPSVTLSGTPTPGGSGNAIVYQVTSVDSQGQESDAQSPNFANGLASNTDGLTQPPTVATPITLTWAAVPGAVSYRIYAINQQFSGNPFTSALGFIGETVGTSFQDIGITPDFTNLYPQYVQIFGNDGSGNCPSTVGFVQQRRYFGATDNNPIGFWGSQPGLFSNFDTHITSLDSDAIIGSIAGSEVNQIEAILELKFMLMLTAGAELFVQGNGQGVVTPSAINASTQSQYGCGTIRPLKVSDVVLFPQALGSFIRDFVFDFVIDGYRGNDITIFSAHLFEGYQMVDWCYQKVPDSIVWIVRSDGVLLSCTYLREQQILAWAHHDFNNGFVENVCSIPENGEYAVYVSIRRVINGTTVRYIERLSSRIWQNTNLGQQTEGMTALALGDPIEAAFCDSYQQYDGRNGTFNTMYLLPPIVITEGINDGIEFSVSSVNYFAIIPPGSYSSFDLAIAIGTAMNAQTNQNFIGQTIAGLIKITCVTTFTLLFAPTDPNFSRSAGATLGFPLTDFTSDVHIAANLPIMNGIFLQTSTAYQQRLTLFSSAPFFLSLGVSIGDQIFIQDAQWVKSMGVSGNQIRCTIQDTFDQYTAVITPSGPIPIEFQNTPTTIWAHAVKTISGLTYLAGQQVSIWADRYVVGSPLNLQITPYTVPVSGILTLDKPYSVIYIGLPMTTDFETLQIDTTFGDSIMGERKAISRLTVYLYNSRGFFGGTQNPDFDPDNLVNGVVQDPLFNLTENKAQGNRQTYDAPPSLMTEWQSTNIDVNWSKEGRIFIRNVDPIPLSILAVVPAGLTSAKVAWSQKV